MIFTLAFWKGAGERAIKTAAQALLAVFVVGVPIYELDIMAGLAIAATATIASLLTSVGNASFTAGEPPVIVAAYETPDWRIEDDQRP